MTEELIDKSADQRRQDAGSPKLLPALNHIAASLSGATQSSSEILEQAARAVAALDLYIGISEYDPGGHLYQFTNLSLPQRSGPAAAEQLPYRLDASDGCQSVVEQNQAILLSDGHHFLERLRGANGQPADIDVPTESGALPAIFAPLEIEYERSCVLNVFGEYLRAQDLPAIEAFAAQLSLILKLAQLRTEKPISTPEATTPPADELARYFTVFSASPDAILVETLDGQVLEGNPAACEMYGYSREELLQLNISDLLPEDITPELESWRTEMVGANDRVRETINKRKDGSLFPVEVGIRKREIGGRPVIIAYVHDTTQIKNLETGLRKRAEEAETMHQATAALTVTLELDQLLDHILIHLAKVVPYDSAAVFLREGPKLRGVAGRGFRHPEKLIGQTFPGDNRLFSDVSAQQQAIILNDAAQDPRFERWVETDYVRSWIGIPLNLHGEVIGFLTCDHFQPDVYHEDDARLAQSFAHQAAIAIENARLFEAERKQLLLARTLQELGTLLTSESSLEIVLEHILSLLKQVVQYDMAAINLLDRSGVLRLAAGRGHPNHQQDEQSVLEISKHVMQTHWSENTLVVIPDTQLDPRWEALPGSDPVRSWIGAALIAKGRFIGSLNLESFTPYAYDQKAGNTVRVFANQAGLAIENARLLQAEHAQLVQARTLQKVGALLTSELGLQEVLEKLLDLLGQVIQYDSASIQLIQEDDSLTMAAGRGFHNLKQASDIIQQISADVLHDRWQRHQVIVIPNTYKDERWIITKGSEHIRSWVGAALLVKGRLIGSLNVDSRSPNTYEQSTGEVVLAFANQAAIAIENARLFDAERSARERAETLREIAEVVTSSLELETVLERILEEIQRALPSDNSSVLLYSNDLQPLLVAGIGYENRQLTSQAANDLLASSPILKKIATELKTVLLPDVRTSQDWIWVPGAERTRSFVGAPIIARQRAIGALFLDSYQPNFFDQTHVRMVETLTKHLAIAIENARLFEQADQRATELEAIRQASLSLTASLDLHQVLDAIMVSTFKLLPEINDIHIFLYNPDGHQQLTFGAALFRNNQREPLSQPRPNGLTYSVAKSEEPIVVADMRTHPLFKNTEWTGAIIGLPLKFGGRVVGVMNVAYDEAREFHQSETRLLLLLADQAAIAIENARLFEQAATERRHLGLLYDLTRSVSSSLEPDEILKRAITVTCNALNGVVGQAFLYLPEEDRLSMRALVGRPESPERWNQHIQTRPWIGLVGWVAQNRQAVNCGEVTQDERWIHMSEIDDDVHSVLCAPILLGDELLGVLTVKHKEPQAFTQDHLHLLQTTCQETGLALSNASRYQQVQRRLAEITLIQSLAQTFNQRLEIRELLEEVVVQLGNRLGYPQVRIFLIEGQSLVLKACFGPRLQKEVYSLQNGIIGRVALNGQAVFLPNVQDDPDYQACLQESVSELAVPIFRAHNVIGVINIESHIPDQLGAADRNLLEVLAGQISVALENATLYERVRRHADELEQTVAQRTSELTALYNLSQEIGYQLSFEELLHMLLSHLHNALDVDVVAGCLEMKGCKTLTIETRRPLMPSVSDDLLAEWSKSSCSGRMGFDEPAGFKVEIHPADGYSADAPAVEKLAAVVHATVQMDGQVVGLLMMGSAQADALGNEQKRLLTTFANQASTAVQRLAALLTAQQKHLENLVEHMPVGVLLLDTNFKLLVGNPSGRRYLEALQSDGIAPTEENVLHRLGNLELTDLAAHQDDPLPQTIQLPGPPVRIFEAQIRPVGIDKRQWVLTLREVTQERENQSRIQSQERLATVGQLAAGIAHDFNNIMAAILVYADLLQSDRRLSPQSAEKVNIIQQQVERAASLIRQILDFSRRSVMEQSQLDLLPFIKEIDKLLVRVLPETIQMELTYQPGEYWINADPTRLQQVFMNLALNARDAMPHGGSLRFEIDRYHQDKTTPPPLPNMPPGAWVRIAIRDSGQGIPDEIQAHIFEPFFTTKPVGQGTGLGLAQVYGIIKQHDGFIDVHSQPGEGASFVIYLPELERSPQNLLTDEPGRQVSGQGETILVVEDDTATRQALEALLQANNYHIWAAEDGKQALKRLENLHGQVDLVVSDMVMPYMGGVELYRNIQQRWPQIKVLLITGHPLDQDNQGLLEKGSVHWLQKPFMIQDFIRTIRRLIQS